MKFIDFLRRIFRIKKKVNIFDLPLEERKRITSDAISKVYKKYHKDETRKEMRHLVIFCYPLIEDLIKNGLELEVIAQELSKQLGIDSNLIVLHKKEIEAELEIIRAKRLAKEKEEQEKTEEEQEDEE